MSKCTAHLICEVHRKLTMSVALSFGFDRSFLWSTELQHNLVSIQPHMIERLRLRYFELSSISAPHDSAAPEHQQQLPVPQQLDQLHGRLRDDDEPSPRTLAQAHVVDTIDGDGCSMRGRVETFFVRWDDFTQRYCMKSNKGRDECVLQAFRHGRRPHDAEFDRLYDLFSWLLHESRLLFSPGEPAALTTAAAGPEALCRSVDEPIAITVTAGADQEPAAGDDLPPATLRSLAIRTDPAGVTPAVSPVHADLARSLGVFFGRDSDVVQGFLDADFVFSSPDGRALRWRSYLLAHLMRDITDAVLGLFGLRQTKCDDYPAAQLRQIHDLVLCRADIAISPQRWAELYRQCVDGTHLDMGEDGLSPPTAMDAAWAELADILGAVFADVGKLVRAVVDFLSVPVTAAPSARGSPDPAATGDDHARLTSFPNHNQIHVLGNLLQLPVMQLEPYCHALSSLLPNDEYWHVVAPLCEAGAATTTSTTTTTDGRALQAAAVGYLACMVRLNARRLDRLELLKPLIRSWITDGARPDFTDELMADLRYFGGVWGSLIIHDIIAGIHGFVTRSIRGYDTRALKQRIVGVVASVLGGALLGPHFARIVRGGSGDADDEQNDSEQADAATALENLLLALRVIDQFGVLKVRCLPHDSLMFVRRNCAPAAERLLDETFNRALNDSAVVLERLMGLASPTGTSVIDRLTAAVLRAIALESPPAATPPRKGDDGEGEGDDGNAEETTRRQQLVDVVRSAVEKMCIGTASGAAVTQSVLPPLPPHTARRQTRKLVRTRRKLEQEAEGPVRVMLDAFFADARRLVAAFHHHHHHQHQHHPLLASALHDVTLALDDVRGA